MAVIMNLLQNTVKNVESTEVKSSIFVARAKT